MGVAAAHHVRVDEAEVADADVHAEVLDLDAQRVGEGLRPGLAGRVRGHAGPVNGGRQRGDRPARSPGGRSRGGGVARTVRQTPRRLISIVRSNAAGSVERTMPPGAMPAFAITTSMPPKRSTVPSTARSRASVSVTSHSNQAAFEPHWAATRSSSSGSRPDQRDVRAPRGHPAGGLGPEAAGGARDEHCLSARRPVHGGTLTRVASGHGRAPEDLSPARVAELMRAGVQLIDVRELYEREAGRIPDDSAHIEMDRLSEEAGSIDRERPVVFYCRTGKPVGGRRAGVRRRGLRRAQPRRRAQGLGGGRPADRARRRARGLSQSVSWRLVGAAAGHAGRPAARRELDGPRRSPSLRRGRR